jgi:hypothetical protein
MVSGTSKGPNPSPPGGNKPTDPSDPEKARGLTEGAAAAERASAGIGTEDAEPAAWLFGDSLGEEHSG